MSGCRRGSAWSIRVPGEVVAVELALDLVELAGHGREDVDDGVAAEAVYEAPPRGLFGDLDRPLGQAGQDGGDGLQAGAGEVAEQEVDEEGGLLDELDDAVGEGGEHGLAHAPDQVLGDLPVEGVFSP